MDEPFPILEIFQIIEEITNKSEFCIDLYFVYLIWILPFIDDCPSQSINDVLILNMCR